MLIFKALLGGDFINFTFPKNYIIEPKLFGVIDYASSIIILFIAIIFWTILSLFSIVFLIKLSIFITLFIPILIFSISDFYKENLFDLFFYVFKFAFSQKVYLYM